MVNCEQLLELPCDSYEFHNNSTCQSRWTFRHQATNLVFQVQLLSGGQRARICTYGAIQWPFTSQILVWSTRSANWELLQQQSTQAEPLQGLYFCALLSCPSQMRHSTQIGLNSEFLTNAQYPCVVDRCQIGQQLQFGTLLGATTNTELFWVKDGLRQAFLWEFCKYLADQPSLKAFPSTWDF